MSVLCSASIPEVDFVYTQNSNLCNCRLQRSGQFPVSYEYSEGLIFGSQARSLTILVHIFVVSSVFRSNCSVEMVPCNRTLRFALRCATRCSCS
jgi:hypothetical protein